MIRRAPFPLVLLALALPACDGATGPDSPPVASIRVSPDGSILDPGDTVRLTAVAFSEAGDTIPDAELTWGTDDAFATVDAAGLVTGVMVGVAQIEASSDDGVVGRAEVRVSPVATLTPDTGRWGALVTLGGDDVLTDAVVYFTDADGEPVRAITRSAGAGELEAWVPVGAADGPLRVDWPGGSAQTRRTFGLTAEADVLAGAGTVPFPYHNPSLQADGAAPHELSFSLAEAGPFTLELVDRGPRNAYTAVRAWLFRTDVEPSALVAFVMTRDLVPPGAVLDSVAYSRASLPAGDYTVRVAPMDLADPTRADVTRAFGLRLEGVDRPGRAPDGREPNDYPAEAPTVALPLTGAGLGFETPYGMDHYTFEVADTTTVSVTTGAPEALVLTYLLPGDATDILAAWEAESVLAAAEGADSVQTVTATVPPGRYTALVWDWSGRARPYDLEITASAPTVAAAPEPAADGLAPLAAAPTARSRRPAVPPAIALTLPPRRR